MYLQKQNCTFVSTQRITREHGCALRLGTIPANYICVSRCLVYLKISSTSFIWTNRTYQLGDIPREASWEIFVWQGFSFEYGISFIMKSKIRNGNKFDKEIERLSHNIKKCNVQLRSNCMAESEYTKRVLGKLPPGWFSPDNSHPENLHQRKFPSRIAPTWKVPTWKIPTQKIPTRIIGIQKILSNIVPTQTIFNAVNSCSSCLP